MFKVKKTMELAISHNLSLPYESSCNRKHGHSLLVTVYVAFDELDENGMVIDFTEIKRIVHGQLDHRHLNDIEGLGWDPSTKTASNPGGLNPTAERLAKWIYMQIEGCYRVDVQESMGNIATFEVE